MGFILTELDTAITFCDVALATRDPDHAALDAQQAKRALESAMRFKKRIQLSKAEQKEVAERTSRLQSLLKQIDERHDSSHSEF